jgi:hypothetical protein
MGRDGLLAGDETTTEDYVAKRRDWNITKDGVADFRSIFADEMVVKKFTSDVTQALAGSQIVGRSTTTLAEDFVIPLESGTQGDTSYQEGAPDPFEYDSTYTVEINNVDEVEIYDLGASNINEYTALVERVTLSGSDKYSLSIYDSNENSVSNTETSSPSDALAWKAESDNRIVLNDGSTDIEIYDDTGSQVDSFSLSGVSSVNEVSYGEGYYGTQIAIATDGNGVEVWRTPSGTWEQEYVESDISNAPAAAYSSNDDLWVSDASTTDFYRYVPQQGGGYSLNSTFSTGGKVTEIVPNSSGDVAAISEDGSVYDTQGGPYVFTPSSPPAAIAFAPDDRLAILCEDGTVLIYDGTSQVESFDISGDTTGTPLEIAFVSDLELHVATDKEVAVYVAPIPNNEAQLTVNDLPGSKGAQVFSADEWVRLRFYDNSGGGLKVADAWGQVSSYTDNGDGTQTWTFRRGDTDSTLRSEVIQENGQVMDYGTEGQGIIRSTVLGPNAPFTVIETWTGHPIDGSNYDIKTLTGNLDAAPSLSNGTSPTGYGLYGGNVYLEGTIVANDGKIEDSVTVGGTGASDLVSVNDIGDVASLDEISSTYIGDGEIITRTIAASSITANEVDANTLTASEIDVQDLFTVDVTIENSLTMGIGGEITDGTGYRIDDDGLELATGKGQKSIIYWRSSLGGSDVASIYSYQNPDTLVMESEGGTTVQADSAEVRLNSNGEFLDWKYFNQGNGGLVFRSLHTSDPSSSEIDSLLNDGSAVLYLKEEGDGDVRLKYYEKKADGTVDGPKTIQD